MNPTWQQMIFKAVAEACELCGHRFKEKEK